MPDAGAWSRYCIPQEIKYLELLKLYQRNCFLHNIDLYMLLENYSHIKYIFK